MADLDSLIDELFPGGENREASPGTTKPKLPLASHCSWDSDSDAGDEGVHKSDATAPATQHRMSDPHAAGPRSGSRTEGSHTTNTAKPTAAKGQPVSPSKRLNTFDDSSTMSSDSSDPRDSDKKPKGRAKKAVAMGQIQRPSHDARHAVVTRHHFDDDSDDETATHVMSAGKAVGRHGGGRLSDPGAKAARLSSTTAGTALERPSTAQRVLFTVPFPSTPSPDTVCPPCSNRCFVSNLGTEKKPHPTLALLRKVAAGVFDTTADKKEMLLKKGAFHVPYPAMGNGVQDNGGDPSDRGGCTHIQCLKCHHVVVRLQGAQWCDADGEKVDLYLTMRNFYPDWSRLATSNVVGGESDSGQGLALQANSEAAVYCCQCSWLTVKSAKEIIETSLTAAVTYKNSEQSMPFATVVPRPPGDNRRPPVWACKGHPL